MALHTNSAVCSDKLIILVIAGNKTFMQLVKSVVGIGPSKHDFLGVVSIGFWTSDWLCISNFSIARTSQMRSLAMRKGGVETVLSSFVCMVSIFEQKSR